MNVYQKLKACITDLSGVFDERLALAGAGGGSFSVKPERKGIYNFGVNKDGTVSTNISIIEGDDSPSKAQISKVALS